MMRALSICHDERAAKAWQREPRAARMTMGHAPSAPPHAMGRAGKNGQLLAQGQYARRWRDAGLPRLACFTGKQYMHDAGAAPRRDAMRSTRAATQPRRRHQLHAAQRGAVPRASDMRPPPQGRRYTRLKTAYQPVPCAFASSDTAD